MLYFLRFYVIRHGLIFQMGRKCVVGVCKTGYESEEKRRIELKLPKVPIFKFPRSENERKLWISALPNILEKPPAEHVSVCELHWVNGCPKVTAPGGKQRPNVPPSIFQTPSSFWRQTIPAVDRDVKLC